MESSLTLPTTLAPLRARTLWAGRVISALPVLFLMVDGAAKLAGPPPVTEAFVRMGIPPGTAPAIGLLDLLCLALYLVPRTAPLGAVLLTGYLGGAISLHMRLGDPLFSHTLFPFYLGIPLWLGLLLRDARVRSLIGPSR
jgi:hypothetical protein